MPFISSFSINSYRAEPFPFNIPAVKFARNVQLDKPVTIFVGDNGTGKSPLLESLAMAINLPLIGGQITHHPGFEAAAILAPLVKLTWKGQTSKGFFFRAEDFSDFLNSVQRENEKIAETLRDLQGEVSDAIIEQMTESMNYSLRKIRKTYGEDMQAFSHGEAYLKILDSRIRDKGIYLLDEPEAALSPLKQLSLMALILELVKKGNIQFLIATHSPILMGIPDAAIYEIQETSMTAVNYRETDHYRITKSFLDNPETYLRHLR